jgi:hypothetical protein
MNRHERKEAPPMTTLTALMAALVAELEDEQIPAPLHQDFSLATVWADLARLAGEDVPAEVAAILDGPAVQRQRNDAARAWVPTT